MGRTNIDISLVYTDINYINIYLNPGVSGLTPSDLTIILNDNPFTNFTLYQKNITGTLYSIIPDKPFSIYDEVYITLDNPMYFSNSLKVYISKYVYKNNAVFVYKLPQCLSGDYDFEITKVNGEIFNLKLADKLIICDGINNIDSSVTSNKSLYDINEFIILTIDLVDKNGVSVPVPDGKYVIKTVIEKK